MRQVIVRYKVKPDRVAENEALVLAVYDELARTAPAGFRYATFRDGASFTHVALSDGDASPLPQLAAFQRFQQDLADRCDEPPAATDVAAVGAYGFWG
jgi:hypothetical protein